MASGFRTASTLASFAMSSEISLAGSVAMTAAYATSRSYQLRPAD
jgi:hypothetical protein